MAKPILPPFAPIFTVARAPIKTTMAPAVVARVEPCLYSIPTYDISCLAVFDDDIPWVGINSVLVHKDNLSPQCVLPKPGRVSQVRLSKKDLKEILKFAKAAQEWKRVGEVPAYASDHKHDVGTKPEVADTRLVVFSRDGKFVFMNKAIGPLVGNKAYVHLEYEAPTAYNPVADGLTKVVIFDNPTDPRLVIAAWRSNAELVKAAQALVKA